MIVRLFFSILLCCSLLFSANAQLTFDHNGTERTYYMDAPDPIPPGAPLVFVLHGYGSSAGLIRAYSNWGDLAISEGFVAVFPQGTEDSGGTPHWNANLGISTTNDHGFLVALAQHLQESNELSPECTYSCGMSNGGYMSYSLACEHPDVFRAIGSVTGAMSAADFGCVPGEVVPIVHLHGTSDNTVSYDNGVGFGNWGNAGVPDIIEHWTGLMGTTTLEESTLANAELVDDTSVDLLRYAGSPGGQEFHHYRVNGGGHDWFGAWGSQDVNSTQVMWDFFSAQCSGGVTEIEESTAPESWLVRQENGFLVRRNAQVHIFDVSGRVLASKRMTHGELWNPAVQQIHIIQARDEGGEVQVLKGH